MGVGVGAELDLLDLDRLLLLARFGFAFLLFVLELAEIHDLADRRIGVGRDLDQVEPGLERPCPWPSAGCTTPTFSPSAPIRRISGARIFSLTRGPVSRAAARCGVCGLSDMQTASDAVDAAATAAGDAVDSATEAASDAADAVGAAADQAMQTASDAADAAATAAGDAVDSATEAASDAADAVQHAVQQAGEAASTAVEAAAAEAQQAAETAASVANDAATAATAAIDSATDNAEQMATETATTAIDMAEADAAMLELDNDSFWQADTLSVDQLGEIVAGSGLSAADKAAMDTLIGQASANPALLQGVIDQVRAALVALN
jgi:hypothetical protein